MRLGELAIHKKRVGRLRKMGSAIEALIIVVLAMLGMGYFLHSLMTGTSSLLTIAGGLGAFTVAWAYGLMRTG
jgi:hypothetical protein